jgi:hypothetical protein
VSPIKGKEAINQPRSLREAVNAVDNEKDFSNYISGFSSKVLVAAAEIKYERNAVSELDCTEEAAYLNHRYLTPLNLKVFRLLSGSPIQQLLPPDKARCSHLLLVLYRLPSKIRQANRSIAKGPHLRRHSMIGVLVKDRLHNNILVHRGDRQVVLREGQQRMEPTTMGQSAPAGHLNFRLSLFRLPKTFRVLHLPSNNNSRTYNPLLRPIPVICPRNLSLASPWSNFSREMDLQYQWLSISAYRLWTCLDWKSRVYTAYQELRHM